MTQTEHKARVINFVDILTRYGFSKTVDRIGQYSPDADLYYRKIDGNRYIVFNHYAKKLKADAQGFDCWISTYDSEQGIGVKLSSNVEGVKLTFHIDSDWNLIDKYL